MAICGSLTWLLLQSLQVPGGVSKPRSPVARWWHFIIFVFNFICQRLPALPAKGSQLSCSRAHTRWFEGCPAVAYICCCGRLHKAQPQHPRREKHPKGFQGVLGQRSCRPRIHARNAGCMPLDSQPMTNGSPSRYLFPCVQNSILALFCPGLCHVYSGSYLGKEGH